MSDWGTGRRRQPERVSDLIDQVLARIARSDVAPIVRLRREWADVAGDWATRCVPVGISNGTLTVQVSSGMEASMLKFEAERLVTAVQTFLVDGPAVERLSIKVGGSGGTTR